MEGHAEDQIHGQGKTDPDDRSRIDGLPRYIDARKVVGPSDRDSGSIILSRYQARPTEIRSPSARGVAISAIQEGDRSGESRRMADRESRTCARREQTEPTRGRARIEPVKIGAEVKQGSRRKDGH